MSSFARSELIDFRALSTSIQDFKKSLSASTLLAFGGSFPCHAQNDAPLRVREKKTRSGDSEHSSFHANKARLGVIAYVLRDTTSTCLHETTVGLLPSDCRLPFVCSLGSRDCECLFRSAQTRFQSDTQHYLQTD